eukprot:scaffold13.g200.t1
MATPHVLCRPGAVCGISSAGSERLAVTANDGGGVTCYDLSTQRLVQAWATGGPVQDFAAAAVYDAASGCFYAALAPGAAPKARGSTVLAWRVSAEGATLHKLATQLHLPEPVHALLPLEPPQSRGRGQPRGQLDQQRQLGGQQQQTKQQQQEQQLELQEGAEAPMEVDGSGHARPAVAAVYASGGVALCTAGEVVGEAPGPRGGASHALAAWLDAAAGVLTLVHCDRASGAASIASCSVVGGALDCGPAARLAPPANGARAVAAAGGAGRTAVLWSDGTLAVYRTPAAPSNSSSSSSSSPLAPTLTRWLAGLRLAAPKGRAPGKTPGWAGKKRGQGGDVAPAGAGASATVAALEGGLLAVVGWSTEGGPGATAVRVIVLDWTFGCIQACENLDCGQLGLGAPDASASLQAAALPPGSAAGQLALAAGGAVVLLDLPLRPPTLAQLVGALAVAGAEARGGGAAARNPCAAAAARALHADELARLAAPTGDGPRLVAPRFTPRPTAAGAPALPLVECDVEWPEVGAERLDAAEAACSRALQDPGHAALTSEPAFEQLIQPLLDLATKQGAVVSPRLLARLLLAAAGARRWGAVRALLAAQHPGSLGACPGLAAALAAAHQYALLQQLLVGATDLGADELAEVLRGLLSPAASEAARQAQREYRAAAWHAAENLVQAAEEQATAAASGRPERPRGRKAAGGGGGGRRRQQPQGGADGAEEAAHAFEADAVGGEPDAGLPPEVADALAVAACAAGAVDGFTPAQQCLHPLLAARHDSGMLLGALRQLSGPQAVALLRYLLVLLRNLAHTVGDRFAAAGGLPPLLVLPHPLAALQWAGLAIDANMSALVLRPEAAPVLAELRSLVEGELGTLRRLAQLRGVLQHIRSGAALPRPRGAACRYSVELLDLRVRD